MINQLLKYFLEVKGMMMQCLFYWKIVDIQLNKKGYRVGYKVKAKVIRSNIHNVQDVSNKLKIVQEFKNI
jgi:hypothetical protein